jgi:hypothetical protein
MNIPKMENLNDFMQDRYCVAFMVDLFALGAFVGCVFPDFSDKVKTGNYLLLPASTLEKMLSQVLIYIVFGSICFLLIFWVDAHLARWTVQQGEFFQIHNIVIDKFQYASIYNIITEGTNISVLDKLSFWIIIISVFRSLVY